VALKVLAADLSIESEAFERFPARSALAAAISDARCVFVYGAHQVDDRRRSRWSSSAARRCRRRSRAAT
jgi:hypothetical protein